MWMACGEPFHQLLIAQVLVKTRRNDWTRSLLEDELASVNVDKEVDDWAKSLDLWRKNCNNKLVDVKALNHVGSSEGPRSEGAAWKGLCVGALGCWWEVWFHLVWNRTTPTLSFVIDRLQGSLTGILKNQGPWSMHHLWSDMCFSSSRIRLLNSKYTTTWIPI